MINQGYLLSNVFHTSTLRALCHPRFGFGGRFVLTFEDNKGNMHVSYVLFANKEEREERLNLSMALKMNASKKEQLRYHHCKQL